MAKRPKASEEVPAEHDQLLRTIGAKIREARTSAGLTGAQVADAIGTAKTWVYAVEEGQQNFTIQALLRLLGALGLELRDVLPSTPDLAAETARMRRLHQVSSALILQLEDFTRQLEALQVLTAPASDGTDKGRAG